MQVVFILDGSADKFYTNTLSYLLQMDYFLELCFLQGDEINLSKTTEMDI